MSIQDHEDEKPLDPAAERVRRKMVRLLAGSLGIMALGLIAVFSAIVYRISESGSAPEPEAAQAEALAEQARIVLPAGAALRSASLDGGRALLHVGGPAGEMLLLVDLASGAVLARRPLAQEADSPAGQDPQTRP